MLGPFNSQSTRKQIAEILGPPDRDDYPDFATYGHLSFDLADGEGPPCRIQICLPHTTHMRPADSTWTEWKAPTCYEQWPDRRLLWTLGRFVPGLKILDAVAMLADYEESKMEFATNGLRILHNPVVNVDLHFEYDSARRETTLCRMISHPSCMPNNNALHRRRVNSWFWKFRFFSASR